MITLNPEETGGWLQPFVDAHGSDPDFIAEGLAVALMEEVAAVMKERGLTESALAERMGVSKASIVRLLGAPSTISLRSIAQLGVALGLQPRVTLLHGQPDQCEEAPSS